MCTDNSVSKMFLVVGLVAGMTAPAGAFLDDKFEKEVERSRCGQIGP